ncbi:Copia protein [Porphyridium purpureum]|uniref:Gag-Pol-p199 n=1 Tax=Porphyridium purpureum TaxID=35688 RepID=A0A5J4Z465_PORPP|nr:Copia protein [Porphyridium purpureum]|eukprot:POR9811..scf295_1
MKADGGFVRYDTLPLSRPVLSVPTRKAIVEALYVGFSTPRVFVVCVVCVVWLCSLCCVRRVAGMDSEGMDVQGLQGGASWIEAFNQLHARIGGQEMMIVQLQEGNRLLQEMLQNVMHQASVSAGPGETERTVASLIGRSLRKYDGQRDKLVVNEWLSRMKQDLDMCMPAGALESQKVIVASRFFEKDAALLWAARPEEQRMALAESGWNAFANFVRTAFEPPQAYLTARTNLYQLKQGKMTVAEFEQRLRMVALSVDSVTDAELNTIFTLGLKEKLRLEVARQDTKTLEESLRAALAAEQVGRFGGDMREAFHGASSPNYRNSSSYAGTAPMDLGVVEKRQPEKRKRADMGKVHSRGTEPPGMGFVGEVWRADAASRLLYKRGTLDGESVQFLVDSGASHNFLGSRFVGRFEGRENGMVKLAGGQSVSVHGPVLQHVDLGFWKGPVKFYVGPLQMDAILGWDWLSRVNPRIDWQRGSMDLELENVEDCAMVNVVDALSESSGNQAYDGEEESASEEVEGKMAGMEHALTHMPMRDDCETCVVAKIKSRPARRLEKDLSTLSFNDEVGIDLVEPGRNVEAIDGAKYMLTHIDRATRWATLAGLRAKTHTAVAEAWTSVQAGRGWPKVLRTDDGNEFRGNVSNLVRENLVKHEIGVPHRPNSHAEQERFHHTLNQGVRANLLQSGLGKRWFLHAAQHFVFMFNRLHPDKKSGKSPYEMRYGERWKRGKVAVPFGCKVVFKNDQPENKYAPRGKIGVLVGVAEHPLAIWVLPQEEWTSAAPKLTRTQDFKAFPEVFPMRTLETRDDEEVSAREGEIDFHSRQEEPDSQETMVLPTNTAEARVSGNLEEDVPLPIGRRGKRKPRVSWSREEDQAIMDGLRLFGWGKWERTLQEYKAVFRDSRNGKDVRARAHNMGLSEENWRQRAGVAPETPQLNLTTLLQTSQALASSAGREAMQKEVDLMIRFKVWDEQPISREEALKVPGARFVRTHFIFGLKFAELPEEFRKVKCRLVAGGNRIWDASGKVTQDVFDYEVPAGLSAIRMLIALAAILGLKIVSFDVTSAYLHADLSGPPTFAMLPRHVPGGGDGLVVRLRRALYGLPRSGSDFSQDARRRLQKFGWDLIHGEKNVYVKKMAGSASVALLALYVDDGLLACVEKDRGEIFRELRSEFLIEKEPEVLSEGAPLRFLGLTISESATRFSLGHDHYQALVVKEFEEELGQVLRAVKSPGEKMNADAVLDVQVEHGHLKIREHVGRLLWLARTVRPDISYAVGVVARYVDSWNVAAERLLVRVMQYLKVPREPLEYLQMTSLKIGDVSVLGYADADFAGCPETRKSTSGRVTYLVAGGNKYLVDWSSRRQRFVSSSTSESEMAALEEAVQLSLFPALSFLRSVQEGDYALTLLCDSQVVLRAVEMGYSPKLHHMAVTRATDLAWIHQVCEKQKLVRLEYTPWVYTRRYGVSELFEVQGLFRPRGFLPCTSGFVYCCLSPRGAGVACPREAGAAWRPAGTH